MTNFFIKYNPYTVECIFKKNGELLSESNKIGSKSNERLQIMLGDTSLTNWNGLFNEIADECDDDDVEITFEGRKIDFEDLQYAEQLYNGPVDFSLSFIEARNDEDVIKELDKIFADIKEKNLPAFKQKNREGKDIFDAYEEAKNGIFEVSVIATMSSGKSTLINALLNTELLPSENEACTANIVNILDNDNMETYEAECLGRDRKTIIHSREAVNLEKLTAYNKDDNIGIINIEGNIPGIASDKISLRLKDTPGPNNSQKIRHKELTYSIIKNTNSVVLYVMNATQLGTDDDKQLLQDIADEMKKYGKQSRDRFIFVLNKCDERDTEGSDGPTELAISGAKKYLSNFGIVDPIVIPTSAKMALLINKVKNGENLTRKERHDYRNWIDDSIQMPQLHFEKYSTLTPTIYKKLCTEAEEYHQNEDTWDMEALIHTGVPSVEQAIGEYIDKYAYPMKVHDAIKDIDAILKDLNMQTKFSIENAENQSVLSKTRQEIEKASKKIKESNNIYKKFKKKIEKFELDPQIQRDEEYQIEQELDEETKPYNGMTKVDKVEADRLINSFIDKLTIYQENCEQRLRAGLEININQRGQSMIDTYEKSVQKILNNIQIHGYQFQNNYSFNKMRIGNLKDLQNQYESIRYREETRTKKNPARKGVGGFFKFWEPWTIKYTVQFEDGIDVDVHKVIVDDMTSFKLYVKKNIQKMFAQASLQVDGYKRVFLKNLDDLNNEIAAIINELDKKTENFESLKAEIEKNSKLMQWESEKEHELRSILEF